LRSVIVVPYGSANPNRNHRAVTLNIIIWQTYANAISLVELSLAIRGIVYVVSANRLKCFKNRLDKIRLTNNNYNV